MTLAEAQADWREFATLVEHLRRRIEDDDAGDRGQHHRQTGAGQHQAHRVGAGLLGAAEQEHGDAGRGSPQFGDPLEDVLPDHVASASSVLLSGEQRV